MSACGTTGVVRAFFMSFRQKNNGETQKSNYMYLMNMHSSLHGNYQHTNHTSQIHFVDVFGTTLVKSLFSQNKLATDQAK